MYNENIRREFEEYMNINDKMWLLMDSNARKCARFFKDAEKSGQLEACIQDFANAAAFQKIYLKLGQNYVFCRNFVPVPYHQIAKVYQEKHKFRGVITSRFLILKDRSGKQLIKVLMQEEAETNGELAQVLWILKQKNPGIYFGYV